jgi:cytosolic iron-sulfur protein assembly protein CIAO1
MLISDRCVAAQILLSCSYDDTIKVWKEDEDDWACHETLSGHTSSVWEMAFNATGDRIGRSIPPPPPIVMQAIDSNTVATCCCAASISSDASLMIWQATEPRFSGWKRVCTLSNIHRRASFTVDWSHHNHLIATGSSDDAIRIFAQVCADTT